MIKDVVRLVSFLENKVSENFRFIICDAVKYYLAHNKSFPGGEVDKLLLLAFLYDFDDPYIKEAYDPTKHYKISFFDDMEVK